MDFRSVKLASCALTLLALLALPIAAHEELTEQEIDQFLQDGSLEDRLDRIKTLNLFRMEEGHPQRARYKIRRAALEAEGFSPAEAARTLTSGPAMAFPFTAQTELRSTGTVQTLTILIDFADHRAATELPGLTVEGIRDNIYGIGTEVAARFRPHESLHEYYRRASQELVDVQGTTLPWHHFAETRAHYEPKKAPADLPPDLRRRQQANHDNRAIFEMVSQALDAADQANDFTQFDNDGDGDIDLLTILYAGPNTGWGSFWWAYRWEFFVPEASQKRFDGKRLNQFVFQFVETRGAADSDFDPTTLMHEMGHAFGLADYYDYDPDVGPEGGVGGLDMMHANQGNHNAFSRWLLDWIRPTVLGFDRPRVRDLTASGSGIDSNKAIAIFPRLASTPAPRDELFLIENRHRVGNDEFLPGDGILVWHVDASVSPDGSEFAYDNSFTDPKLIRLVRADDPEDFGRSERATAATYFTTGSRFTPDSVPSSDAYGGRDTGITMDEIGPRGEFIQAKIGFATSPSEPQPTTPPEPPGDPSGAGEGPQSSGEKKGSIASVLTASKHFTLDELEALDQRFRAASADSLAELWNEWKNFEPVVAENKLVVLKLLAARWAAKDGLTSATSVMSLPEGDPLRSQALSLALESWVKAQPVEAAHWYLSDRQVGLRQGDGFEPSSEFVRRAFQGLYAKDWKSAMSGIDQLRQSHIVPAVDGIFDAGSLLGESLEAVTGRVFALESNLAKARAQLLRSADEIELSLQDLEDRRYFRESIDSHGPLEE